MKIANYNDNGVFINITDARPNPLEKDKYLIPAKATEVLPSADQNYWNGTAWETKADYRGQKVYDINTQAESIVDYPGDIKEGFTLQKPPTIYHKFENASWIPDEVKKEELITQLSAKINTQTDSKIFNDFSYQDKEFYLSLENQFNYKSAYDARAALTYPFQVKGKTEFISFANSAELEAFYLAGFAYVQQCIAEGWAAKEALKTKAMAELISML